MPDQAQVSSSMDSAIQNATNTLSKQFGLDEADRKILLMTLMEVAVAAVKSYSAFILEEEKKRNKELVKKIFSRK